jgi:DNA-binding MarR family transcriptional regulator
MAMKQLPSDPVVATWVCLVRASTSVMAAVEADGKAAGFPPLEWYDVLWDLERAGSGVRPFEMEGRLLLAQYNLSRVIDRMCRAGYVEKRPCEIDGRGQVLFITEEGKALRRRMWPIYSAAMQRHIGARLEPGEAEVLSNLLAKLVHWREETEEGSCGA